jgi:hypothetical protein
MVRVLALAGGVAGAVALSQFPEFSQQYLQRLAGQADALGTVMVAFDASAQKAGLTRQTALAELSGTTFRDAHQADMRDTILRAERIGRDLALLRAATPMERMALVHRFRDSQTLRASWADFRPAIPATADGAMAAGVGFVAGWAIIALILAVLRAPFRRRAW